MDKRTETAEKNLRLAVLDLLASLDQAGWDREAAKERALVLAARAIAGSEKVLDEGREVGLPYKPSFLDPRNHRILEFDPESGYALICRGGDSPAPFVVCFGYDPEQRTWSQGHYHERAADAVVDYERSTGLNRVEPVPEGCFCTVRWREEDLRARLREIDGELATQENVERCKRIVSRTLRDLSIETGWAIIEDSIDRDALSRE